MDDAGRDDVEELTLERVIVVRSRRPRALWGVLAAVAVATGALVVISANDDGGTRPGLPVALGSSGGGRDEGAMAADSMLAWVTYVAGDDLPALGGEAPAYRLRGSVDEADVRALADALVVDGEIVHDGPGWKVAGGGGTLEVYEGGGAQWWYSSGSYDTPVAGSGTSSGSAGSGGSAVSSGATDPCVDAPDRAVVDCIVTVTTYPPCTASDGPPECLTGECPPGADCAETTMTTTLECPLDTDCDCDTPDGGIEGCVHLEPPSDCAKAEDVTCPDGTTDPPTPPADLPSEDEARAIALDLLASTGLDTDGAVVTVDGPYDAWYVTVEPRVDGVPSGLLANVAVGSEGKVISAGGYLGEPERLGDYPLLDTRAAIDRANVQQGGSSASSGGAARDTSVGTAEAPVAAASCAADPGMTLTTECDDRSTIEEPVTTTVVPQCKVQPDGSEICETVVPGITCPQVAAPADEPLGAPETIECTPPLPEPGVEPVPLPEPEPVEIVLVDAEPSLVLLAAIDGSTDAYLVPGYRFTDADGGRVDLPAVSDEALTGPPTTDTTVPDTVEPPATDGGVDPAPCEVLVEEDPSGTTHTVQPNPSCVEPDPGVLGEGEEPQIGVGYYVDVNVLFPECNFISVEVANRWWWADAPANELDTWSTPTEGGTFTLLEEDQAQFVGDVEGHKAATLVPYGDGTGPPLCA